MKFRNRTSGLIREAEEGSVRHALFVRSDRYEPVKNEQPDGHLESLTVAQLHDVASDMGVTVPSKATKAQIVEHIREG